jgi:DNA-binding response OmpR family regulator
MTSPPTSERLRGRVLIVDSDWDTLGALADALRARGHAVVLATDGRTGLARAVETSPEIVLVDRDIPVVDVRTFLEVLRDNPRTAEAHAFVMGRGDLSRIATVDARAEPIVKPFQTAEVAARVERVLAARAAPAREPELRGDLAQVALFDLLQVFSANRRTGTLRVESTGATAEVRVHEGRIVDAIFGAAIGEKALFRALSVSAGQFVFLPGVRAPRERIDAPTEHLLIEAARQGDELARLRAQLPSGSATLGRAFVPGKLSSTARELLELLDEPRAIDELLDLLPTTDLEALRAVTELLTLDAVSVIDPHGERVALCDEDAAITLRAAALRLRRPGLEGTPRLALLGARAADVFRFGRALAQVDGFVAAASPVVGAGAGALGRLGTVKLDGVELELFVLPVEAPLRPLWGPFLAPTLAALHLAGSEEPLAADAVDLLRSLGVTVLEAAPGWHEPAGAALAIRGALGAITPAQADRR